MDIQSTCCFTGHRPADLPFGTNELSVGCAALKSLILREIEKLAAQGYRCFITGAAWGIDLICGEAVLELRREYPHIRLEAAIPYSGQDRAWPAFYRSRYARLLDSADSFEIISGKYVRGCYHARNRYMVDRSSLVMAVFTGKHEGGTAGTLSYAIKQNKNLVLINPLTLHVMGACLDNGIAPSIEQQF